MSNKQARFKKYMESVDSYILHQMFRKTQEERIKFRARQIEMYDDKFECDIERIKRTVAKSLSK